ncbi:MULTISPECIES: GDP-mannose 4,6-dehydratase [Bacillaceae]|uniref:GDP-mannose 4,6-dehydratase n=1 Tax=Bacillaceae TaxID=186817 RepID=UPI000BA58405|nr:MULTISPECIES: GDP-mannose 4,6-dehydratase [Bacillaceae]PAE26335.1 hypothetical protein CHI10_03490 [Bacillus sp. 7894-2]URM31151.1 GDP-mannose 4,6-dehydratase [Cytobacillus firmus]
MRALITGVSGFAGKYLENYLTNQGAEVFGTSRQSKPPKKYYTLDLADRKAAEKIIREVKPTHIFHLAGASNVRDSWKNISDTFESNTMGTVNLLEAAINADTGPRIITIGSSEEYGNVTIPLNGITEEAQINPISPYGLSKSVINKLINQYKISYGIDAIHLRPFNHIGPGQKRGFVTSDFAYQIALINKTKSNNVLKVGNLEAVRDFTDVRDIVKAYYQIALKGKSGESYNVCSGKGIKVQEILNMLLSFSAREIIVEQTAENMRASDIPFYVGSPKKIKIASGWEPIIPIKDSLKDIYHFWLSSQQVGE